jgi:4-hydroxysphinganine ceramide fatty acyl 2-hydroxylase
MSITEHCVSTEDTSVRMFRRDWLERLTHVHPAVPHIIYVPLVVALIWRAPTPASVTAGLMGVGLVLWSLIEYVLHRHLFHAPDAVMQETHDIVARVGAGDPVIAALPGWRHIVYFIMHGIHHEYPSDSSRLVMPPGASVPLALLFFVLFRLIVGTRYTPGMFAGFLIGYLAYDTIHFAVHHVPLPTTWGRFTKRRHYRHHFVNPDRDYGVSSPLWDIVLGTRGR